MKTITLEIEDSKFEQFMTMINLLKSDVVKKFEVQKNETLVNQTNDPMAQELQRRIQEIDDGVVTLTRYNVGMDSMMERIRVKYA
jgi:hypothetical protein